MKKMKFQRRLTIILAIVLCCVLFQATVFGGESKTDDTDSKAAETIEIKTAGQLAELLTETDGDESAGQTYILTDDIQLDTSAYDSGQKDGHPKRQFAGTLNGKGHTITVKDNAEPLFGYLNGTAKSPATVTNLKLVYSGDVSGTTVAAQAGAAVISDLAITVNGQITEAGSGKSAYTTGVFGTYAGKDTLKVSNVTVSYGSAELEEDEELTAGNYAKADAVVVKKVKLTTTEEEEPEEAETDDAAAEEAGKADAVKADQETKAEEEKEESANPQEQQKDDAEEEEQTSAEEEKMNLAEDETWTVTFEMNGHGTAPNNQTVKNGEKATEPKDPEAEGFTFDGWFSDEELTMAYDFDAAVEKDLTLYAGWTEAPSEFTVSFEMNGHGTAPNNQTVKAGGKATEPKDPEAEGFTFGGWYTDEALSEKYDFDSEVKADLKLYAKWEAVTQKYSIVFDLDNGTKIKVTANAGTTAQKLISTIEQNEKFKEGKAKTAEYTYTFDKWEPTVTDVTKDAEYKAVYKATKNTYKITFVDSDGKVLKKATKYEYGTSTKDIVTPKNPTKANTNQYTYQFEGWTPTLATVTKDTVYTAKYKSTARTYKVTFNANGHGTAPATQTVSYNGMASRPANPSAANYIFGGWYLDQACTRSYNFSTPVTGNVTLYARWVASATTRTTTRTTTATTRSSTQPRTGDDANLTLWIILLIAAVAAGGSAIVYSRRKKHNG